MQPPSAVTKAIHLRKEINTINPNATFVIVTKTQPISDIQTLFDAGFRDFGENRVEQFVERQALIPAARWHYIGHLARKNAAKVVGRAELIHSVDSVRLLEKIERSMEAVEIRMEAKRGEGGGVGTGPDDNIGFTQMVLLQVNTSGEEVKQGFEPHELREFTRSFEAESYPHVRVKGLMTMAPFVTDEAILRPCFSGLRKLRNEINSQYRLGWNELSMGMTNDYRIALEEGATMVRIGTAVFD